MSEEKQDTVLGFITHSRAWYAEASKRSGVADEIMIGRYCREGGCKYEAGIRFHDLGNEVVPRLEIFSDGVAVLSDASEFIAAYSDACTENEAVTVADVERLLLDNGFTDLTETERPGGDPPEIKITYRGWPGHYICADRCTFHLNTLIEYGEKRVVVSTVGKFLKHHRDKEYTEIGSGRHLETMVFESTFINGLWVAGMKSYDIDHQHTWANPEDDMEAQRGHEAIVAEFVQKLESSNL